VPAGRERNTNLFELTNHPKKEGGKEGSYLKSIFPIAEDRQE
jgi:hypothetical protein